MISNNGTIIRCLINRPRYNFTAIRLNSKISDSVDIEKLEKESEAPVEGKLTRYMFFLCLAFVLHLIFDCSCVG